MRKLVIMRGPQGSGKSTILRRTGLDRHAISLDAIRQTVAGPILMPHGGFTINPEDNAYVWKLAMESLERRIGRGETIAWDATLTFAADVEQIAVKGEAAGYAVLVVDRYSCDPEAAFAYNLARPEHERVPRTSLDRVLREASTTRPLDARLRILSTGDDLDASVDGVRAFLEEDTGIRDLSAYDRIVHVGDLQGCLTPLLDAASPVALHLDDPKTFFVFVGDLLDRGLENGRVLRWWLDAMHGRDNVALIAGNHEDHIEIAAAGRTSGSREFTNRTLPQLREAGITDTDLAAIAATFVPVLPYRWRGSTVLVSHAGFPRWPQPLWAVPQTQLRKGAGHYQTPVDRSWTEWSLGGTGTAPFGSEAASHQPWQVHGHRNQAMLPVIADERSINLEGQVEFGGHLRLAVLDGSGWTPFEIRNTIHKSMQEFRLQDIEEGRQTYGHVAPLTPWAARGVTKAVPIDAEVLDSFRSHPMVAESVSETRPHLSALNFTKQAFWSKSWDQITIHTRGLYVDTSTREIAARAYPKFWNHGERLETRDETLEHSLKWPVCGFVKENGFLGITGYDSQSGDLIVASKSRIDGEFAIWFQEMLREALGEAGMEKLLRFNRDQIASCVFEVIDPVRDPHIIEEARPRVVLLDAIHRADLFEKMPYDDLVRLAAHLGCEVKRHAFRNIPNWQALSRILGLVERDPKWAPSRNGSAVEGVVVEDTEGYQFKAKARFYAFWKHMRGAKDRVAMSRRKDAPVEMARYADDPDAVAFVRWCMLQNDDVLSWDIVRLRNAYLADPTALLDGGRPPEPEAVPDQTGFLRGVDAIAAQLDSGTVKSGTIARLLARADEDEHRRAAFDAHPASTRLRARAEEETSL